MNKRLSAVLPSKPRMGVGRQAGAVLIVSLIILTLLTLIGLNSMQSTMLEEKMANNLRQHDLAFQAAEAVLRDAEMFINGTDTIFNPLKLYGGAFDGNCSTGFCKAFTPGNVTDWTSYGRAYSGTITGVGRQPRYVIELINFETDSSNSNYAYVTFRVTAVAWAADTNAVVRLQSTFKVRLQSPGL